MVVALNNAAVTGIILIFTNVRGFRRIVAGATTTGASALAVLLFFITLSRRGKDSPILPPSLDSFVAILV
jgi:hypothetical protein